MSKHASLSGERRRTASQVTRDLASRRTEGAVSPYSDELTRKKGNRLEKPARGRPETPSDSYATPVQNALSRLKNQEMRRSHVRVRSPDQPRFVERWGTAAADFASAEILDRAEALSTVARL